MIGVTSQISTGNTGEQGNVGIGFAIPINTVRNVAAQIIKNGKVEHAFLGVSAAPVTPQLAKLFNLPARAGPARRSRSTQGSGADKAGLKAGTTSWSCRARATSSAATSSSRSTASRSTTFEQLRDAIAAQAARATS